MRRLLHHEVPYRRIADFSDIDQVTLLFEPAGKVLKTRQATLRRACVSIQLPCRYRRPDGRQRRGIRCRTRPYRGAHAA